MILPQLFLISSLVSTSNSYSLYPERYKLASTSAVEAYYISSGIKGNVDRYTKDFEKQFIPKPVLEFGSVTVILLRTATEKRFTWTYSW